MSRDVTLLSSLTLVADEGQRRAVARELERQLPGAAGLPQPRRGLRPVELPPAVQQHDELRLGAAVRHRASAGRPTPRRCSTRWSAAGSSRASTRCIAGEPVTFTYTPGATFVVSGIAQDFRGANNYRPNVTCDPLATRRRAAPSTTGSTATASSCPTDPSQPFGNAERNSVRGPKFWQFDFAASKRFALGGPAQFEFRFEAFNLLNHTNFRAPNGNRSAGGVRHDHVDLRSAPAAAGVQAAVVSARRCRAGWRWRCAGADRPPRADRHRAPRRQRSSARAHARGLPAGGRDGRGLHRAGPRLDEGRRADRAPRERDRRHHRRRRSLSRIASGPRRSTASRSPAGSPRTSRSRRSRRCARASGCRSDRTPTTASSRSRPSTK